MRRLRIFAEKARSARERLYECVVETDCCCRTAREDDFEAELDTTTPLTHGSSSVSFYFATVQPPNVLRETIWNNLIARHLNARALEELMKWDREYLLHGCMRELVRSVWFEPCMMAVVVANAFIIGMQIDYQYLLLPGQWQNISMAFNLVYTFEVISQWWVYGCATSCRSTYNTFALLVTLAAWVEFLANSSTALELDARIAADADKVREVLTTQWHKYASSDLIQIFQLFRILHLGVVFRTFGKILDSFLESVRGMVWVLVLSVLFFFISACITTISIGHRDFSGDGPGTNTEHLVEESKNFSSILHSMFTLFELATIEGWPGHVRPFIQDHKIYVVFFICFIITGNLFLLNLFTAVVVEKMLQATNDEDRHLEDQSKEAHRQKAVTLHRRLLELNDEDNTARIGNLRHWIARDLEVRTLTKELGLSAKSLYALCKLCDHEDSGEISLRQLHSLVKDTGEQLDMSSFIKYQQHMVCRIDYVDSLCQTVVQAVDAMAAKHA
mmetsp:Transcript_34924/g.96465  ORF Transcript_34924/g.96465 Transcript_34924/m.96465 type:complete len:502 (+) Transcript_34924:252-1757(+)